MHIIVVACIVIFAGFFVSSICLLRPAKVYKAPEKKNRVTKMAELVKDDAKLDAQLATVKNQRELLKGITVAPAPINRKEKYAAQQKPTNPDLPGAPWLLKLIHVFDKEAFLTKLGKFQKRHWTHLNNVYSVTDEADGWGNSILPIVPNWRMDNDDFVVPSDVHIGNGFPRLGAHGKERRAFGVGDEKRGGLLRINRHLCRINRRNRTGKTDGRDAETRNRNDIDRLLIQNKFLNGFVLRARDEAYAH